MSNVVCKKCGVAASSKCPGSRETFPVSNHDALVYRMLGRPRVTEDLTVPGQVTRTLTIAVTLTEYADEPDLPATPTKLLEELEILLGEMHRHGVTMERVLCLHEWEMAPGQTCLFGCCTGLKAPVQVIFREDCADYEEGMTAREALDGCEHACSGCGTGLSGPRAAFEPCYCATCHPVDYSLAAVVDRPAG